MATRSASSASAMAGCAVDRAARLELRDAGPQALLGPCGLLRRRGGLLLDAVDALGEPAAGEALRRPGAVALDPDGGERRVRVTEGELAHLLRGDPLAPEVLATRTVGVVDEDLEPVLALPGPQERDGMADVTDPLQG